MCDEDIKTRRNALRIYEITCSNSESRVFNLPPVNFDAETLYDLLNTEFLWSPPPILQDVQISEIKTSIEDSSISKYFTGVPCHSQSVERLVKQVTEASKVVCGFERRNKVILNTLASQNKH